MMKMVIMLVFFALVMPTSYGNAGFWDQVKEKIDVPSQKSIDESTIVSGLKEALSQGTGNAISSVAKLNGYLNNKAIKILMPEKIRNVGDILNKFGFQQ